MLIKKIIIHGSSYHPDDKLDATIKILNLIA
jgi:hypothetical protein